MDIRQLRSFLRLAKRRNFGQAARDLGLSQPALSQRIKKLEDELGAELFIRDGLRSQLSQAGEVFEWHARRLIADFEEAQGVVQATGDIRRGGTLRVGHSPSHREPTVAATVALLRRFPDLHIVIEEMLSPRIEARVRDGRLDLGLVHAWGHTKGIEHEQLTDAPLRLIVNRKHRLAQRQRIESLAEIREERFTLTRKGLRSRHTIDTFFEMHDFAPKIAVEANGMATVLALVRTLPALIAILPVPAPHLADLRGLPMLDLPDPLKQSTFLLWRGPHREPRTGPAQAFRRALHKHLGSGGPGGPATS